jgi:YbbR domain-containing protein
VKRTPELLAWVGSWIARAVFDNPGLKALSLIFAVGLFVYLNRAEEQYDRSFPVGIFVRQPPPSENRELMTQIPPNIYVTLRGSARALEQLLRDKPIPPIELDLRDGERSLVTFDASMLSLPPDVAVTIFDPPSIELEWQDVITRTIPIQAAITGEPAEGYVVNGQPVVEPNSVTVRGPKRLVEVMQFVRLAAFDVTGLTEGLYRRPIAIDAPPQRVTYLATTSTTVTVRIARRVHEAKFERLAVEVVGVANGTTNPKHVMVTVIGPPEVVRALRAEQVVPRVDISTLPPEVRDAKHGSVAARVTVDIGNAESQIQPPTVTVKW